MTMPRFAYSLQASTSAPAADVSAARLVRGTPGERIRSLEILTLDN
jgi:hypothetical protein